MKYLILVALSIFLASCRDLADPGWKEKLWEKGYWEGYEEAKEGLGQNSIHYGPAVDGTKSELKIVWKGYRAGRADFKEGRPYNSNPPTK